MLTWRRTLTRSAGPVTRVVGMAEKNPAKASSVMVSWRLVVLLEFGEKERASFLPRSYDLYGGEEC
jgi:hypothetical protein